MRTSKVYVSQTDLNYFNVNEMFIDPFYNDLYNPTNYKNPILS